MNMTNFKDKNYEDEIDFRELFGALWGKKLFIGFTTTICSLIFILYSLMLPNVYKSKAILMPVEVSSGMRGMLGQYSGLANLAGISLPAESSSKSQEAIARIKSYEFFNNHFLPKIKLENLLAVKEWNQENNTLIYKENKFNTNSGQWLQKNKFSSSNTPSSQEAYSEFKKIINISEDKNTLFISLSVEHHSPIIAQRWVELIMKQIDLVMRDKDKQDATESLEYLTNLAPNINYENIKETLTSLQQEQMKRLMLIEASESYIFKVLDAPIVPEMKSSPNRLLIFIVGIIVGILSGVLVSLVLHYSKRSP